MNVRKGLEAVVFLIGVLAFIAVVCLAVYGVGRGLTSGFKALGLSTDSAVFATIGTLFIVLTFVVGATEKDN